MKIASLLKTFIFLIASSLLLGCREEKKDSDKEMIISKTLYTSAHYNKEVFNPNDIPTESDFAWLRALKIPGNCDSVTNVFNINLRLNTQEEALAYEEKLGSELLIDGEKLHNIPHNRDSNILYKKMDNMKIFKRKKSHTTSIYVCYKIEKEKISEILYSWGKASIGTSLKHSTWENKLLKKLENNNNASREISRFRLAYEYYDVYDYLNCSLDEEIMSATMGIYKRRWKNNNDRIVFRDIDHGYAMLLDYRKNWYSENKLTSQPAYIYDTIYVDKKCID